MKKFLCLIVIFVLSAFAARGDDGKKITTLNDLKINDIIADPEGNLYLATEYGGFYISTDEGATWKLTNSLTKKYNITCILYDDFEGLFCSTMDGAFIQSTDKGVTWRIRRGYDEVWGFTAAIDLIRTKKKYKLYGTGSDYGMCIDNHNEGGWGVHSYKLNFDKNGIIYSLGKNILRNDDIDNLESEWININNEITDFSICLDYDSKNRLYVGTQKGVYYSDNKGNNWSFLSPFLQNYKISSIIIVNDKRIIVGTDSSGIFISDDVGITWKSGINPFENNPVKKFYDFKSNLLFSIAGKNLFKSSDKGITWININSALITDADSLQVVGWMPSVNFFDLLPTMSKIYYLKFINNDTLIVVQDETGYFNIFNTKTGNLENRFKLPTNPKIHCFEVIEKDTVLMCTETNGIFSFGFYSIKSNNFNVLFTENFSYFRNQFPSGYSVVIVNISKLKYDSINNKLYIYSYISGLNPPDLNPYSIGKCEIRYLLNGEFIKFVNISSSFSNDMKYYLSQNEKLYNSDDVLIYDIRKIPGNADYMKYSSFSSATISPNNKFIVLENENKYKYLIVDFNSGYVLREIKFPDYTQPNYKITYDDNFLITASNESAIKIYNLYNTGDPFDDILFWRGDSNWEFDIAKNSNTIVFGGHDGVLRLWKPNMNLTSVEEKPEPEPELINNLIFPNPAEDFIEIPDFNPRVNPGVDDQIRIFNSIGECVMESVIHPMTASHRMNVEQLPPGIYFLRFGGQCAKFVKM